MTGASSERPKVTVPDVGPNQLLIRVHRCGICASDLNLTDVWTCYKAFRASLVRSIPLRCDGFGFEPEITIKLAQRQAYIYETPISYHGRTYEEGKKIGLRDAFKALGDDRWIRQHSPTLWPGYLLGA